jgi:hypothetical protein
MKIRFLHTVQIPGSDPFEKGCVVDSAAVPGNYLVGWIKAGHCVEEHEAPPAMPAAVVDIAPFHHEHQ